MGGGAAVATSLGAEGAELRVGSWGLGWEGKRLLGGLTGAHSPQWPALRLFRPPGPWTL